MLKVDLLPRQFAIARTNKKLLALILLILAGSVVGWFLYFAKIKTDISSAQAQLEEAKPDANKVRDLQAKAASKQSDLQPIQDKLQFIARADRSGAVFWDRFHQINEYIWERAQVSSFSITPPSSVQFTVTVHGTQETGRFLLNLLRCEALTNINMSGLPAGKSIQGAGGITQAGPPGMMGGPPGMMGGPPGMMGGPPGMGLPMSAGAAAASGLEPGSPDEPIVLQVTAILAKPITTPYPTGAAPAMGGPPGMMGGPPGMMGGPPGMMGGPPGGPGMMGPPGAPGGPPPPAVQEPPKEET